jgi:hypothetical protein
MKRRAAKRGETTMAMIGAVFMVRGGRVRLQSQSQMRIASTHKIDFGTKNLGVTNTITYMCL